MQLSIGDGHWSTKVANSWFSFFLHHTIHCTVPPVTLIAHTHMEKSGSYAYYAICKYRWKYNPVTFAASLSLKNLRTSIQCTAMSSKECSIGLKLIFGASTLSTKSKHKHRLSSQFIIISHFFVPFESIVSVHICTRCKHMSRLAFSNFENFSADARPHWWSKLVGEVFG